MTAVYFIRHAEKNPKSEDSDAPLTDKGLADRSLVTAYLCDKNIDVVLSSPYKRSVDTVSEFAQQAGLEVQAIYDFRERRISSKWIDDFKSYAVNQWADFSYKLEDGESLHEVQERNIAALQEALRQHNGKNIVIGTHGTSLSTIIRYFDATYGFADFMAMAHIMPWVVKMEFDGVCCVGIEKIDLFQLAAD